MTDSIFTHLVVPIANETDATATCDALQSYIDDTIETITVVHVIEKKEKYVHKEPPKTRKEQADRIFSIVETRFPDEPTIHRELRFGSDIIDEILAAADEFDATAVGFTPQPDCRLNRFLSGSKDYRLITESDQPVVVFSEVDSNDH